MALVSHDALLRYSELHNLRLIDVEWLNLTPAGLSAKICIRISKTTTTVPYEPDDPYANVVIKLYTNSLSQPFCAAHYLRLYWIQMGFDSLSQSDPQAFLFPRFQGLQLAAGLTTATPKSRYLKILHSLLVAAGIDPSRYSGHSGRSGGATDLFQGNASLRNIQLQGRWHSDAFLLYIRDNLVDRAEDIFSAFHKAALLPR